MYMPTLNLHWKVVGLRLVCFAKHLFKSYGKSMQTMNGTNLEHCYNNFY